MSWEEDFLMAKVRELEDRLAKLEQVCPGNNFLTSTEETENQQKKNETNPQSPALTTENPSKIEMESSTANSTGGNTQGTLFSDDINVDDLLKGI